MSAIVDAHAEGVSTAAAELADWTQAAIAAAPARNVTGPDKGESGSVRSDGEP